MSRSIVGPSSQYLSYADGVVDGFPVTYASWMRVDGTSGGTGGIITQLTDSGNFLKLGYRSFNDDISFSKRGGGGGGFSAAGPGDYTRGVWFHACGVAASSTSMICYLDGVPGDEQEGDDSPTFDKTWIGQDQAGVFSTALHAEAAIWNVALTAGEVGSLAAGMSPLLVRRSQDAEDADDEGDNYPSSASGTSWTNPTNIGSDDNSNATYALTSGSTSNILLGNNYGFTIPTGATIDGVTVEIGRWDSGGAGIADATVQLVDGDGSPVGTNKSAGAAWPAAEATASFGGSADNWTAGLTAADVNSSSFGVRLQAVSDGAPPVTTQLNVDFIRVTIDYTATIQEGLVSYWPLGGPFGEFDTDIVGTNNMTAVNAPTWSAHRGGMIYPSRALAVPYVPAAAGGFARSKVYGSLAGGRGLVGGGFTA